MKRPRHPFRDLANLRFTLAGSGLLVASTMKAFGELPSAWVLGFAAVLGLETIITAVKIQRQDRRTRADIKALETMVGFLEALNRMPPSLPADELHDALLRVIQDGLRPLGLHARLWLLNESWKTLRGRGDHPALRPGAPSHLPTTSCPAFSTRDPFSFRKGDSAPCPSETFHYPKHRCLPVRHESTCYGVLFIASDEPGRWTDEEAHLMQMMAHAMAMALQRRSTLEHLQEKMNELHTSFEVGATSLATFAGSTQSLEETTIHLLDGVKSILNVDRASLMLWDPRDGKLRTQWVRGGKFRIQSPLELAKGEGMAGWALETGQPYGAEYAMGDPHYKPSSQGIQSLICVPIFTVDHLPLGVINAVTLTAPRTFREREIQFLLAFARQAAMAIENAQLHQRNRANIDQLQELNRTKSRFLSLVSHDLRGPLTGIRGFCEILKEQAPGPLNESQMELLTQLEKQVEHQERMVDDLLDYARMEQGRLAIQTEPADLKKLLEEEIEHAQRDARERGLSLRFHDPQEPLPLVRMDAGRIRQVVWNLIHNALKFTPEGGRVIVQIRRKTQQLVEVEIEDTGVGLSTDTQDRIFEKFFQVTPGGSRGAQGLGLGLAICREIVVAHGGSIVAQSPGLGLGTTFRFSLPVADPTLSLQSDRNQQAA